ncbi:helix-turn-helix transcriptional regulator [Enterobacter sp. PTB]|uniref:helix-turn-helix transcriptional regulator n=1 Tax=Enterobacter sp. PTB TaxID=3143437 RepID=UPI003DA967AF
MSELNALNKIDLVNDSMMDMKDIVKFTGLSDKWFYKLIKDGLFPKPVKMGRSSRWFKSEIEAWVQKRIVESRGE